MRREKTHDGRAKALAWNTWLMQTQADQRPAQWVQSAKAYYDCMHATLPVG